MTQLPASKLYALRHGVTGRIWEAPGGRWLWPSVKALRRSWKTLHEAGIVGSEFEQHVVVEIHLRVVP